MTKIRKNPCKCPICKRHRKWKKIEPTLSRKTRDFVYGLLEALSYAEDDANYYNAILQGDWLQNKYKREEVGEKGREVIVKIGGKVRAKYLFCK